jgi:homoserine dehydrogenase
VVADIVDIARERHTPVFGIPAARLAMPEPVPIAARRGRYYLRLMVVDRPGVIADVAAALRDQQVSMESFLQRGRAPGEAVPVVLTTHETDEAALQRALGAIGALEAVLEPPRTIRIEDF